MPATGDFALRYEVGQPFTGKCNTFPLRDDHRSTLNHFELVWTPAAVWVTTAPTVPLAWLSPSGAQHDVVHPGDVIRRAPRVPTSTCTFGMAEAIGAVATPLPFDDVEPSGGEAPNGTTGDETAFNGPVGSVDEVVCGP